MCCRIQIASHLFPSAIYFILCLRTSCWTTRRSQRAGPISPDPRQIPGAIGPCRWHGDRQHSTWWPRSHPLHSNWVTRPHHAAPLGQRPDPTMARDPGAVSLPAFDPHLGQNGTGVSVTGGQQAPRTRAERPASSAGRFLLQQLGQAQLSGAGGQDSWRLCSSHPAGKGSLKVASRYRN